MQHIIILLIGRVYGGIFYRWHFQNVIMALKAEDTKSTKTADNNTLLLKNCIRITKICKANLFIYKTNSNTNLIKN